MWFKTYFDSNANLNIDFENYQLKTNNLTIEESAVKYIKYISETYPAPYYLYASGGIDSQVMLYLWKKSKIPFTVVSFKYIDRDGNILNYHDLTELVTFSIEQNINITFHELSILKFLENEMLIYAIRYQCTSPQICTHMKISDHYSDGTIIFSGNFIHTSTLNYTIYGLERFRQLSKKSMIPYFLMYDADLSTAFMHSITSTGLVKYNKKVATYKSAGFPVIPQKEKYTGFEKIKDYYDQFPHLVTNRERILYSKYPSRRIFDLVFRYRLTEHIKYEDQIIFKNLPKFSQ